MNIEIDKLKMLDILDGFIAFSRIHSSRNECRYCISNHYAIKHEESCPVNYAIDIREKIRSN